MRQFVPPQMWTRHAVLPGIPVGSPNKHISECFCLILMTVQRIRKKFGESNGDYECTAARETDAACSDKKRTPEFVGEIKTMIDNDPSKSMRVIARA